MEKSALMKVTIIEDENGKMTGYSIECQASDVSELSEMDRQVIERIRDTYFWRGATYYGRQSFKGSETTRKLKFQIKNL